MRIRFPGHAISGLSLLMIAAVAAPAAHGQNLFGGEIIVDPSGTTITLRIYDALTGEPLWPEGDGNGQLSSLTYFNVDNSGSTSAIPLPTRFMYLLAFSSVGASAPVNYAWTGNSGVLPPAGSFYRPNAGTGVSDTWFKVVGGHMKVENLSTTQNGDYVNDVLGDRGWTLPYDHATLCSGATTATTCLSSLVPYYQIIAAGVSTAPVLTQPGWDAPGRKLVPTFEFAGVVKIPTTWATQNWDVTDLTLKFRRPSSLDVSGTLNATGTTFTASDATRGWGGINYTKVTGSPTTTSTLSGVTVSGVRTFVPPWLDLDSEEPIGAAVTASNRTVVITGQSLIERGSGATGSVSDGTVHPTNGVQTTGTSGRLTVTGLSVITNHGGVGVLATGGAFATVTGSSQVLLNSFGGVRATGFGSNIGVLGYAQLNDNLAAGVRADQQGFVSVRSAGGTLSNTSASGNRGGLYTRSGGGIDGQQCDGTGGSTRPNRFVDDLLGNSYDATAFGGSTVSAPYAFWGAQRETLVTDKDASSALPLYPLAPDLNTPQPGCPVLGGEWGASAFPAASLALPDEDAPQAERGQVSDAVAGLAAEARAAAWSGDTDAAFAILATARAAAETEDDHEAVFEAMAALLAGDQPAGVVAALEADAAAPGVAQVWAQRALAVAYAASGQSADADMLALGLTERTEAAHAAFGHGLRVRLAADAGDETEATNRLTAFASEASEASAEAFGSAVALVAATFPEADLSGALGGAPGRGVASAPGTSDQALTAAKTDATGHLPGTLDVFPNPAASGQATVRVTLAEAAAQAVATVYDALGRRVAVLHDGALMAGSHAFALGSLPAGVYVVHVRTASVDGAAWAEVRRVTVTR